jgi:hypothetical protein
MPGSRDGTRILESVLAHFVSEDDVAGVAEARLPVIEEELSEATKQPTNRE